MPMRDAVCLKGRFFRLYKTGKFERRRIVMRKSTVYFLNVENVLAFFENEASLF